MLCEVRLWQTEKVGGRDVVLLPPRYGFLNVEGEIPIDAVDPFTLRNHAVCSRVAEQSGPAEWEDFPYLSNSRGVVGLPGDDGFVPSVLRSSHV